jgi:hypothetical protein
MLMSMAMLEGQGRGEVEAYICMYKFKESAVVATYHVYECNVDCLQVPE